jgi:asparagine synthetase B (glutamine-hydrolysing)
MPEVFIRRAERPCMGRGVEVRLPFLDLRVVNAHFTMPMAVRLDGEGLKSLLRKCVADLLPPEMRDRPKMPFGLPAQRALPYHGSTQAFPRPAFAKLFNVHAARLEGVLTEGPLVREGILNGAYIRERLEPQRNPQTAHFDPLLWKLWSLAEWHARWIRGGHVRRAPSLKLAGAVA